jgi:hypothetical protein
MEWRNMKITEAPNTTELRAKAQRVHALENEITELKAAIAAEETTHKAARAQAVLNGTAAPAEPKTMSANRKKLADMVDAFPLVQTGLNAAITAAKMQAHERYSQLAEQIDKQAADRQSEILGRMLPILGELGDVIGDAAVLKLINPGMYSGHLLRKKYLEEYAPDGLNPGLAAVPSAIEALILRLKVSGHAEHLIDTMEQLESQLLPHTGDNENATASV